MSKINNINNKIGDFSDLNDNTNNIDQQNLFILSPGEELSEKTLQELKQINDNYSKTRNFQNYLTSLSQLFNVPAVKVTENSKKFLGGFLEGEASVNVSVKKAENAFFGVVIDPEFSITQHVNGFSTLYSALATFQTGRVRHKGGSNATIVFIIDNRQSIEEKVIPFYKTYVNPYGSPVKVKRLENFLKILQLFKKDGHKNVETLLNEMLPLWDAMRMQRGQHNEAFPTLESAQEYVKEFVAKKQEKAKKK